MMSFGLVFFGVLLGFGFAWILFRRITDQTIAGFSLQRDVWIKTESTMCEKIRHLEQDTLASLLSEKTQLLEQKDQIIKSLIQLKTDLAANEEKTRNLQIQLEDRITAFQDLKRQTQLEFENLAHKIFDSKSRSFTDHILTPLKEKIQTFEKSIDDKYNLESKERHSLRAEIDRLVNLNTKLAQEAHSLTQALRGDSRIQGDWGELVLEKILETSGLREGVEYITQKSLQNDDGARFRPDIILNLPDGKNFVIDSKVSLKSFELYRQCQNQCQNQGQVQGQDDSAVVQIKKSHLQALLVSIQSHIENLSSKHYSRLKGIHSPEFVFLFIPIEPAYLLAMNHDPDIAMRAWRQGVALVTTTTLLTSLKTVANIWRLEKQNKNALEIAQEGGKLYDKFVGFLEDFEKIGTSLEVSQKSYINSMNKLKEGPGNIFRKLEHLRTLGASPTKRLKPEFTTNSTDTNAQLE